MQDRHKQRKQKLQNKSVKGLFTVKGEHMIISHFILFHFVSHSGAVQYQHPSQLTMTYIYNGARGSIVSSYFSKRHLTLGH